MKIGSKQKVIGRKAALSSTAWKRTSSNVGENMFTNHTLKWKRNLEPVLPRASKKKKLELEAARDKTVDEDPWYCKHPEVSDEVTRQISHIIIN